MSAVSFVTRHRETIISAGIVVGAALIVLLSVRPYAGAWNDGSRLATVECLVDYHTLAIDRSIFVQVPEDRSPYGPKSSPNAALLKKGSADKLLIDGQFYSDKSPVPALLLAAVYLVLQCLTGLSARAQPELFCYLMNLLSSGVAYVGAVWCVFQFGRRVWLSISLGIALCVSFAVATVTVVYVQHVNNHILLLGVAAALTLALARFAVHDRLMPGGADISVCPGAERNICSTNSWPILFGIGSLTGLGYAIDLGAGPVLVVCVLSVVTWRCRRLIPLGVFVAGALPWVLLHHVLNYAVGGTLKPANAVPEYFQWKGCPFTPENMTGVWNHPSIGKFFVYAAALLFGKHGFFGHNLPLFLVIPAVFALNRARKLWQPEILFALAWCGGTWFVYALTSTNYSGQCCTIRWFVPLLAPAYYVLAVLLRDHPTFRVDFMILSGWGAVMMVIAWSYGPWIPHMVPGFWAVQGAAHISWLGYRVWRRRRDLAHTEFEQVHGRTWSRAA